MLNRSKTTSVILMLTSLLLVWGAPVWSEVVEYDGLIEPYEVVEIGAPAEGIVAKVTVDRSSPVKKGQTLVELESSVEWAVLRKAKVMASFDGEIGLQKTQLAFSKRVHERIKKLEAVSTHDKDQAATEISLTGFRLEKAREKRTLANLELKRAQAVLYRRSIRSPISGVVVDRYVTPGEYVNTQPLLRVAQIDPLRIEVIVPARMFGKISPGMSATIIPELPEYGEQTATVTIVDKVFDSASSTFGVRLEMPNAEYQIPCGLKCLVRFEITENPGEIEDMTSHAVPVQKQN
jgi:RND family efflux transporter MFP subunit